MADITQTIAAYSGDVPNRNTQTQSQFDAAATSWATQQESWPGQYNAFGTQANSLKADVLGYKVTASAAAVTAVDAQAAAEAARNAAEGFRDNAFIAGAAAAGAPVYPGGSPYSIGDCCSGSDGNTYRSLVDDNDEDPTTASFGVWRNLTARTIQAKTFFL